MSYEIHIDKGVKGEGYSATKRYQDENIEVYLGSTLGNVNDDGRHRAHVRITPLDIEIIGGEDFYQLIVSLMNEKDYKGIKDQAFTRALKKMTLKDFTLILERTRKHGIEEGREEIQQQMRSALGI